MPNKPLRVEESARVFAALGDEVRLHLVANLCKSGPLSIAQLTAAQRPADTTLTRQGITKHLVALEAAGLVHGSRQGRERVWELDTKRLEIAQAYLEHISQRWDDALERLRVFVESE